MNRALTLIRKLNRTGLLTPWGIVRLLEALLTTGTNLMTLLRLTATRHPHRIAVMDGRERLTYAELWHQAEALALALQVEYGIQASGTPERQRVVIATRNHAAAIKAIFAVSRLGAHVFLLNPEMSGEQLLKLTERLRFDFCIYDATLEPIFKQAALRHNSLPAYHPTAPSIDQLARSQPESLTSQPLKKTKTGNIVVMTGGTTGQPKPASRKPSLFNFLPPFIALLCRVHLDQYRSLYIATPIYHGFGLAALLIGIILGAELYVTERFEASKACALIAQYQIEVVTLVPLMLQRMLNQDPRALSSLQRILTGGAALNPTLATETLTQLGPILFNLYGTSEAGFCIMGTPAVLDQKPTSIGLPVWGVRAKIMDESGHEVHGQGIGHLCIRSAWSTSQNSWIETGDLAYQDREGDLFLCGRVDDMIVSGGENVYPIELENVLMQHSAIAAAAVVGIPDPEFGQRLKAVLVRKQGAGLNPADLRDWLKRRVARYQMPAAIEVWDELPYTALGKLDKKALR